MRAVAPLENGHNGGEEGVDQAHIELLIERAQERGEEADKVLGEALGSEWRDLRHFGGYGRIARHTKPPGVEFVWQRDSTPGGFGLPSSLKFGMTHVFDSLA